MAEVTTPNYKIRYATEQDIPEILRMVQELASYERALHEVLATEEKLFNTLSFPTSSDEKVRNKPGAAKTLLIVPRTGDSSNNNGDDTSQGGKEAVAGMALFFNNYSTWLARPGIFLEDLFVRPQYRKKGFGKALLQALARECVANDYGRLEWSVLKWNKPSIDFYESEVIGAVSTREEWEGMRVTGQALVKLAESGKV
ncbi:Acetyltransferase (GNAT) [Lithohypha guttulata]|uniref:Acetyltransferase (GNAT) n=1 Tax=Lithohypha guttulata TaxID=1690604 RepID=A0AAN7Y3Z4_9EURO|nr:Acetyltransferase (GNAT) [Lithohypha guttulata]